MTAEEKKAEEDEIWKKEYDLEQEQKEKGREKSKKRHIERKKERIEEKTGKPKRKYVKKTAEEKEAIKSKKEQKQSIKDYNVSIPVLPEVSAEVDLPEFYAVEKTTNKKTLKKGKSGVKIIKQYKLVNPLTKQRNLAIRDGVLPITLKRKEVDKVSAVDLAPKSIPLSAFVKSDQRKVAKFNLKREKLDNQNVSPPARPDKSAFSALERGRPEHLPKNIAWHQENGTSKPPKKIKKKEGLFKPLCT